MKLEHVDPAIKATGDAISIVTVVGTLAQVLPAVAALLTIVWTILRIMETTTVRSWFGKPPLDKE
jgi:hypothetical protein